MCYLWKYQPATDPDITICWQAITKFAIHNNPNKWYNLIQNKNESGVYWTNPVFVNCASPAETNQANPYDQHVARITSAMNVCHRKWMGSVYLYMAKNNV